MNKFITTLLLAMVIVAAPALGDAMPLPESRDYDAVDGGPLPATTVNVIQDEIVSLSYPASVDEDILGGVDYDPGAARVLFLNASGAGTPALNGLAGGVDRKLLEIWNVGTTTLWLRHEHASPAAGNRLLCPGSADIGLTVGKRAVARYHASESRWRVSE